jgi:hypothetical protein
METCALCLLNKPTKTNTHYLSYSIIKNALNENGSKEREKTLSFDLSNDKIFTKVNFKSAISPEKLHEIFGRELTEEELEESKSSPDEFAVHYVFCPSCEDRFTEIESKFSASSMMKMRYNKSFEDKTHIDITEIGLFRLFWLLQIWRTSICIDAFRISEEISEKLRLIILQGLEATEQSLKQFPLAITFLYTGEDLKEYETNHVVIAGRTKPNFIEMNDFAVQFYETIEDVQFFDYYGLNNEEDYKDFVNYNESVFKVKILSCNERKAYHAEFDLHEKVNPTLKILSEKFSQIWNSKIGYPPPIDLVQEYLIAVTKTESIPIGEYLSENRIIDFTVKFIAEKVGL